MSAISRDTDQGFVSEVGESLWLFEEMREQAQPENMHSGFVEPRDSWRKKTPSGSDPLVRAKKLARKMPYIPKGQGQRDRAGHAICRLLLASLAHSNGAETKPH